MIGIKKKDLRLTNKWKKGTEKYKQSFHSTLVILNESNFKGDGR